MAEKNEERLKRIASMKAPWDILAKSGLASGNDRWVTEASIQKANIDEEEAEAKKDNEITERIFASGDKDAMLARFKELKEIWFGNRFRRDWTRVFPS